MVLFNFLPVDARGELPFCAMIVSSVLLTVLGCEESKAPKNRPATTNSVIATPAIESKQDPLADVLQLANAGDLNSAIQKFVSSAPDNWIESTALEDIRMSEATFAKLNRDKKAHFQQKFIDRVGEIKRFARSVITRANEANQKGDKESAERILEAVHRLGRQLRDFDTVLVFQQTGKALVEMNLSE
jgi:hypothetical protein